VTRWRPGGVALLVALGSAAARFDAATPPHDCAIIQALDGSAPFVSDAAECAHKSAPASTFKVPHALIALETGVVTDPLATVSWDGTRFPNEAWNRPHSLDSAMKWSALWFYQRTAGLIGRERMQVWLRRIGYGSDTYTGEQTAFWLNGDLEISPMEQLDFMSRLVRYQLPVERRYVEVVKEAFAMPPGAVTNATGTHPFVLRWPVPLVVHAKTGNATVAGERVSWIVGHVESASRQFVFVARARGAELSTLAGVELALRALNAHPPA
jgi:beta-lactamase class D